MDKGTALNEMVWKLFEKAGFYTKPNSENLNEHEVNLTNGKIRPLDLLAEEPTLGVRIIGSNKARKSFNVSFSQLVHDLTTLKKQCCANGALFVSSEKKISENDIHFAKNNGVLVWNKEELEYYELLSNTIGEYAKYEIIRDFGIETIEQQDTHTVLAINFKQLNIHSNANIFSFTMTPENLLKTCVVLRKAKGNIHAYQRILRKSRLQKIAKFLSGNDVLLLPNIILHFEQDVSFEILEKPQKTSDGKSINLSRANDYELVKLCIPLKYASMELIDGQHRLFSFLNTDNHMY